MHSSTWFTVPGLDHVAVTEAGTRPGDPWADFLFDVLGHTMATEAAGRLAAAGLTPALDWPHEAGLMEQPPGQQLAVGE
eukprot:11168902-Lingulodinium_polyedra.AAC.1